MPNCSPQVMPTQNMRGGSTGGRQGQTPHGSPPRRRESHPPRQYLLLTRARSERLRPTVAIDLLVSPQPVARAEPVEEKTRPVIHVADFEAECEQLVKNMKDAWDDTTARDARALVRMFKGVLEEHGVEHTGQITQYHLGKLRQHFNEIPIRWGQSARMRAMSAPELRAEGEIRRKQAEAEGQEATVGLSPATIRKHFGNLNHFLKHVRGHGFELDDWTFEGLRPKKPSLAVFANNSTSRSRTKSNRFFQVRSIPGRWITIVAAKSPDRMSSMTRPISCRLCFPISVRADTESVAADHTPCNG